MPFRLSPEPITCPELGCPEAGAFVVFEGRVRNEHRGREVVALEYEAYDTMAESEGSNLILEAKVKFELIEVAIVHRVGRLDVGETAVWIVVSAAHRKAAFQGCEFLIDELKKRVPIWKKEHYREGDSGWISTDESSPSPA